MDLGIKNKTAIVSGASQGLGRTCAEMLANEGVNLIVCSRNYDNIFSAARSISETFGVNVVPIAADISLPESPDKLVNEAVRKFDGVDILINNTGIFSQEKFEDPDESDWEKAFNLTLMSVLRMTQSVLPYMTSKGWGRIINLVTLPVQQQFPGLILTHSLRYAVVGMTKTLSNEAASQGVCINTIVTANVDTEGFRSIIKKRARESGSTEEKVQNEIESVIPLGRIGMPEELAWFVTFLASEKASYITGMTIDMDSGIVNGLM